MHYLKYAKILVSVHGFSGRKNNSKGRGIVKRAAFILGFSVLSG
jgi:hypothetical protein